MNANYRTQGERNSACLAGPGRADEMCEFFLVSLPGLEDLVAREVHEWFPEFELRQEYGGVTVFASLEVGLTMNLVLKAPTRVLVRVTRFRCRDFPKLYRKVLDFPWQKWLNPNCELEIFAASKRSRLKIKSRIEETCLAAWEDRRAARARTKGGQGGSADRRQRKDQERGKGKAKLYVRVVEDEFTLSLDTSGERLHKRGARVHVGEAPLRETIAASLLQMMDAVRDGGEGRDAGAAGGNLGDQPVKPSEPNRRLVELIDPMAGGGTFLLEAAYRDEAIEAREFGFETFARAPAPPPGLKASRSVFTRLCGFEMDEKTMNAARFNLRSCEGRLPVELRKEDFFTAAVLAPPPPGQERWLVCNPPYGERLRVEEPLGEYYGKLFAAAERVARPDRACFLLPAKGVHGKFALPVAWKVREKRRFLNGGIAVIAFLFVRRESLLAAAATDAENTAGVKARV